MTRNIKNFTKITSLVAIDVLAFYFSLLAAFFTRKFLVILIPSVLELQLSTAYFLRIWWLPLTFLFFIAYEQLYIKNLSFWDETREFVRVVTVSMMAVLAVLTIGRVTPDISRMTVIFIWLYGLFFFPLFRFFGKRLLSRSGLWKENVIIIGAGKAGLNAARGIQTESHLGYNVIGFLDDDDKKIGTELAVAGRKFKVFGKVRNFSKFVKLLNISTIVIAIPSLSVDKMTELTNHIQKYTKNILLIPDVKGIALTNTELNHLFFQQLFLLKIKNNLKSSLNRFIKRSFDLLLSVMLLPFLVPLIGVFGILIKLESPGPFFYRHKRVGRGGKIFMIYKFRSMYRDSIERLENILEKDAEARREWDASFKLKNDPRVTRIGKFLRETSLDELPQIINVLKGEMSLVGPRPVVKEEISKYYRDCADYYYLVRPGLTGLWQVSGRSSIDYEMRVKLDSWYVLNWSLWLDLIMLIKTIGVVVKRQGAY